MSNTETAPAMGDNLKTPDAYTISAADHLRSRRRAWDEANRTIASIYQTVVAIIFGLAEYGGMLPEQVIGPRKTASAVRFNMPALIACDVGSATRRENGAQPVYENLRAFVATNLGTDIDQTATNLVMFAARLARMGYTLADWNGKITQAETGQMLVEVDMIEPDMPRINLPGIFRIHPKHIGWIRGKYAPDAVLCVQRLAMHQGKEIEIWQPAENQVVALVDHRATFLCGAPDEKGVRAEVPVRVGVKSFMDCTAEALAWQAGEVKRLAEEAEKAAKIKADAERAEADRVAKEAEVSSRAGAGQGDPDDIAERNAERENAANDTVPGAGAGNDTTPGNDTATGSTGGNDTAPGADSVPGGNETQAEGNTPAAGNDDKAKADAAAKDAADKERAAEISRQVEMRVNEERTRMEKEKLEKAMTPGELPDWVRSVYQPGRMKGNEELIRTAFLVHAHLTSVLQSFGVSPDYVKNPTEANAMHEVKRILAAKPKAANAAQHARRTGK